MRLAVGTAKYLVFFFNFIFFITGILIIAVASIAISREKELSKHLDEGYQSVPIFLILVGIFVTGISFFGCCGAIRNNYCMLMTFAALLGLIFVFEFGAGIAAYTKKDAIVDAVKDAFDDLVKDYYNPEKNDTKAAVDDLQEYFKCCGSNNATDWKGKIPNSCCPKVDDKFVTCSNDDIYKIGCNQAFGDYVSANIATIGGIGVGIAFIQILGIVLSCCLATSVKDSV